MSFSFRCHRLGCNPLDRESRLLHFGRFDTGNRSKDVADARKDIGKERKMREERTGELSDRLNAKRLNAPAVDPNRGQELLEAERETVLLGDMPDTPRYKGLQLKVEKLEKICASRKTIQGIQFGFNGQEFTLISADEDFVQKALLHVAEEISELRRSDDRPELRLPQAPGEPDEDYAERIKAVEKSGRVARDLNRNRKSEEAEQWALLYGALRKYKSEFDGFKQILAMLDKDPKAINKVSDKWKKENPASYTKALKDAAKKDASVLTGKEKEFSNDDFLKILDEAKGENPIVWQYYPDAWKKANTPAYRTALVEGAKVNGSILRIAGKEFDKYWKGSEDQYKELCMNALNQEPSLFIYGFDYLRPQSADLFRDIVARLSPETKLAIVQQVENLSFFDRLPGKYAGFIDAQLTGTKANEVLIAVARKSNLWNTIQAEDPTLHKRLDSMIRASTDPNVKALLRLSYIGGNEKIGKKILEDLLAETKKTGVDIPTVLREGGPSLEKISQEAWRANEDVALALFAKQGELFQYAPESLRNDKVMVMKILKANAGAYAHVSARLRNDPEVLYAALRSDEKRTGDFYWKYVGSSLKFLLELQDFKGIPSSEDLLRRTILAADKKKAVTADTVDSLMDHWTDEMKKDSELVAKFLLGNPDHPEYFLDADSALQGDINFIADVVKHIPDIFQYINHADLSTKHAEKYFSIAAMISVSNPKLFEAAVPESLRKDPIFIAELSKRIPPKKKPGATPPPPVPRGTL